MQLWVDSANLADLEAALARGIGGITTNPTLLARERCRAGDALPALLALVQRYDRAIPVSVEVGTADPAAMPAEAGALHAVADGYPSLYVKIPIGWDTLPVIAALRAEGVRVNCTACMTVPQALLAAQAGAALVSVFWGRIRDGGADPVAVVRGVRQVWGTAAAAPRLVIGSIRAPADVAAAAAAGADAVTVPPAILAAMAAHPQTDAVVAQFLRDAREGA